MIYNMFWPSFVMWFLTYLISPTQKRDITTYHLSHDLWYFIYLTALINFIYSTCYFTCVMWFVTTFHFWQLFISTIIMVTNFILLQILTKTHTGVFCSCFTIKIKILFLQHICGNLIYIVLFLIGQMWMFLFCLHCTHCFELINC